MQVRSCRETTGLFTVNIFIFDPDGDINFDFYYTCKSESEWHCQFFDEVFHCFTLEEEKEEKTTVMKVNPRSGHFMCAPLSDPYADTFNLRWPVKNSPK